MGTMKGLHHIGLRTKDVAKSTDFYTNTLGFELQKKVNLPSSSGGTTNIAFVKLGSLVIEIIQPGDISKVESETGMVQHIAIDVSDIDAVVADLKAKGVATFRTDEPVTNEDLGSRLIFFEGPNGETLELFEDN